MKMRIFTLLFTLFILGVKTFSQNITNGLVAYYPFNGNANDESGNGNNGTINGAILTTDRFGISGKAFYFDGISSISAADNNLPFGNAPRTISTWVFCNQKQAINGTGIPPGQLIKYGPEFIETQNCNIALWGDLIRFSNWSSPPDAEFNFLHPLNEWFNIIVKLDSTNEVKIYINGQLSHSSNFEVWNTVSNSILKIGEFFSNGKLDDIRIYNRALSETEILTLYNTESKNQLPNNGLIAYYPFNSNSKDESGNGNNAIVFGAQLTPDRFGKPNKAYLFNGNGDNMSINTMSNITGNLPRSLSAWIKIDSTANGDNTIYKGGINGSGNDFTFIVRILQPGLIQLYLRRYESDVWSEDLIIPLNKWLHVAVTYDGTTTAGLKFFLNGVSKKTSNPGGLPFDTQPTYPGIGDHISQGGVHSYFKGGIDELKVYNRQLSDVEIMQMYDEREICDNKDNDGDGWIDETCIPSLSIGETYSITEGNSGSKNLTATVTLNHQYNLAVTVNYKTIDQSAKAKSDYKLALGKITFNPGEKSKVIKISIIGDSIAEPDETFQIQLDSANNATIVKSIANCSILNDDAGICNPLFADGFDYPFGDKGYDNTGARYTIAEGITPECNNIYPIGAIANPVRESTLGGWHNANDVGNYLQQASTCGIHPGEDWNFNSGTADVGQKVYAIANGVIVDVATTYTNTNAYGYRITIEHTLPNGSKLWSLYLHITDSLTDGTILSIPTYAIGQAVKRGDVIGKIARWNVAANKNAPHLHLEIRTTNPGAAVWANDNGVGYYTDVVGVQRCGGMTATQVSAAFANMTTDGIIDPSDFIEHNRRICNAGVQTAVAYPPYNCVAFAPAAIANDKIEVKNELITMAGKISISPNPTTALLHITGLPNKIEGNEIEVINTLGITVKKWQGFNGTELNVSGLPAGLYVLRINAVTTLKFIKE